ncbi:ruBisCO large subunit-binding protein subunit beta, chloroplastic [Hordeum vulgare]|nr:ruBisCO large subunit-binding protein subunit beta, chloroplastic [Hordeum vulgare]
MPALVLEQRLQDAPHPWILREEVLRAAFLELSYPRPDDPYLLLHNTAYDRYLGVTFKPSPLGHHGCHTEQHDCDDEGDLMAVMWWASGPGFRGVVLLRSVTGRFLRAKGRTKNKVELEDPVENIGAKLVRQAATKTNDLAGDGTTTFVILAQGMIAEGVKIVAAGANTVQIARGIEKTTKALVADVGLNLKDIYVESSYKISRKWTDSFEIPMSETVPYSTQVKYKAKCEAMKHINKE